MTDREQKIQTLVHGVERLLMELKHHVPPEVVELDKLETLVKEIKAECQTPR